MRLVRCSCAVVTAMCLLAGLPAVSPAQDEDGSSSPAVTADVSRNLWVSACRFALDFDAVANDRAALTGVVARTALPWTLRDQPTTVTVAGVPFTAVLNRKGDGSGSSADGHVRIRINQDTGSFGVAIRDAKLRAALGALGAVNADISKPGIAVTVPVTLAVGASALDPVSFDCTYTADAGTRGQGVFTYGGKDAGAVRTGCLQVLRATIYQRESKDDGHYFQLSGVIARPDGEPFTMPPFGGAWSVTLRDYTQHISYGGKMDEHGNTITFHEGSRGTGGIRTFRLRQIRGTFSMTTWKLPAIGAGATDWPLSDADTTQEPLLFSVEFGMSDGTSFEASTTIRMRRRSRRDNVWRSYR